jgi:hypothetical protein
MAKKTKYKYHSTKRGKTCALCRGLQRGLDIDKALERRCTTLQRGFFVGWIAGRAFSIGRTVYPSRKLPYLCSKHTKDIAVVDVVVLQALTEGFGYHAALDDEL